MTKQFTFKRLLILLITFTAQCVQAQNSINAYVSDEGKLSFRITEQDFYISTSQKGKITGYGATGGGKIKYDYMGRMEKIGDLKISYDYEGRIDKIGDSRISYDYSGRVDKIGSMRISYNYKGYIDRIGEHRISYNYDDTVDKIGNARIYYDYKGNVTKIKDEEGIVVFGSGY